MSLSSHLLSDKTRVPQVLLLPWLKYFIIPIIRLDVVCLHLLHCLSRMFDVYYFTIVVRLTHVCFYQPFWAPNLPQSQLGSILYGASEIFEEDPSAVSLLWQMVQVWEVPQEVLWQKPRTDVFYQRWGPFRYYKRGKIFWVFEKQHKKNVTFVAHLFYNK